MESLPKGLLTTATKVSTELDGVGPVNIGDVVQLWKVYSANPSAHDDDVGYRLENFFWRIWGSRCLNHTLLGTTLASLFLRISEPNPFSLVQLSKATKAAQAAQSSKGNHEGGSGRPAGNNGKAPLHPILKKPRNGSSSGETHKTTRLLLTDIDGQSTTRKPSNPPTPVPPSVPTMGDTAPRQTQKKAVFVASKAKSSKRRPVIMRRKSSQQSSGTSSTRAHSPPPDSPQLTLEYTPNQPIQELGSASKATVGAYEIDEAEPLSRSHSKFRPNLTVSPRDKTELTGNGLFEEDTPEKDPVQGEKAQLERRPELPELFLSDLRELLDTDRPEEAYVKPPPPRRRAFYAVEPSLPEPNFFSATGCRRYDARYLSAENYEQPSSMKLVDKNFRKRFSDRVRQEQVLVSSLGTPEPETKPKTIPPKPVRAESSSTVTNATPSPSRFGDSHGKASTAPSSAVPFRRSSNHDDSFATDSQGSTDEEVSPVLTNFSMPRRQSQLSVMIEQSRLQGGEEGHQETEEVIEEIRE
ncbi:GATA-like domain-containing protein [Aspergillus vadensis CBS 113365]|uniref:Nitrogen regulatory protein areA GATA-like domain-containing protein n=1 Tax=Aspergillus vadensis (strain CBS 113365 / IMI 142717 / IBT 24658) TaxID=1448311 RepID=A0A319BVU1_ASPVC|nr:hypothetical protein BO88DRAFT_338764 [Aspergillus vadensis CBS 113365]PYH69973.1 hypothetical protein BO88DRAFT_338764 [Aspergillus vadensis CBS 113365]